MEFYEYNPDWIVPANRQSEIVNFVKSGLRDLSISRPKTTCDWGIDIETSPDHTVYVWLDALTNYLSATVKDGREALYDATLWPCDIHIIGKDILKFHAVYWPAFLMAADIPLPRKIIAHGWWTQNGHKIAKSTGKCI